MQVTAETDEAAATLFKMLADRGTLLNTQTDRQVQIQVHSDARFREVAERLAAEDYYLVTVVANDERDLEDRWYKIYYIFSHPSVDLFVIIEYLLKPSSVSYCSVWDLFHAVDPFEREMCDMLGLSPAEHFGGRHRVRRGSWLHDAYPPDLHPLRRSDTTAGLRERVAAGALVSRPPRPRRSAAESVPPGEPAGVTIPVGPIHAGIIESGQFLISTTGETIEDLRLRLGFAHRGVERMFQSYLNLLDGWRLAEQVSGDTSFAHSLAYCRAAEMLTDTPSPPAARLLRALLVELERIHNHIADIGGIAEDVGMEQFAAEFAVIREEVLRLDRRLTGHRYLRGANRVGGLRLPGPPDVDDVAYVLREHLSTFEDLATALLARSGFRERTIQVGVLTRRDALQLGVTGLVARASGVPRDSRLEHPVGACRDAGHVLRQAGPILGDDGEATAGDVFARTLVRAREVVTSRRLVEWLIGRWSELSAAERADLVAKPRILPANNFTSAIGQAESCRGDVVYWLMQDKMNGIYRCKVRDPSTLNWPAVRACALPKTSNGTPTEMLVADFPLLNNSFSLSYAGNDL